MKSMVLVLSLLVGLVPGAWAQEKLLLDASPTPRPSVVKRNCVVVGVILGGFSAVSFSSSLRDSHMAHSLRKEKEANSFPQKPGIDPNSENNIENLERAARSRRIWGYALAGAGLAFIVRGITLKTDGTKTVATKEWRF
jgi:hypothetical protein